MLHLALLKALGHGLVFVNLAVKHHSDLVKLQCVRSGVSTYLFIEDRIFLIKFHILILEVGKFLFLLKPTLLGRTSILHEPTIG